MCFSFLIGTMGIRIELTSCAPSKSDPPGETLTALCKTAIHSPGIPSKLSYIWKKTEDSSI